MFARVKRPKVSRVLATMTVVLLFIFKGPHGLSSACAKKGKKRWDDATERLWIKERTFYFNRRYALQQHIAFKLESSPLMVPSRATYLHTEPGAAGTGSARAVSGAPPPAARVSDFVQVLSGTRVRQIEMLETGALETRSAVRAMLSNDPDPDPSNRAELRALLDKVPTAASPHALLRLARFACRVLSRALCFPVPSPIQPLRPQAVPRLATQQDNQENAWYMHAVCIHQSQGQTTTRLCFTLQHYHAVRLPVHRCR